MTVRQRLEGELRFQQVKIEKFKSQTDSVRNNEQYVRRCNTRSASRRTPSGALKTNNLIACSAQKMPMPP